MKKATILLILLAMTFMSAFICIGPVGADHEAQITVDPVYYKGGGETKTFNVTNLDIEGADPIIEVVITFPEIHDGDYDYKPVDYEFPEGWKATYEPALRQIIFVSLYPEDNNIPGGESELFVIEFEEGPTEDDEYEWIVSTTDKEKIAHTYYVKQWLDTTAPFVRIDYPEDGATVIATWDPYPDHHYFWIEVTAYDDPDISGISLVEVQLSNETWTSGWVDITDSKTDDTYSIKWYDLDPEDGRGWYDVTARAFDRADNTATDKNEFEYWIIGVWIELTPDEGTVWRETTIDEEGVYRGGKFTYLEKTLGTEVEVTGGGFTKNSKVNVTVDHPLWGEILVVKNAETDEDGGFTDSFLFPTAPHGIYKVSAIDLKLLKPLKPAEFTVIPEIIYKPAIVIGPAVIEVIATGLPANGDVVGLTCNDTDALLSVNRHVEDWETDANGTLQTPRADKPGLLMPVLEPETYEIGLNFDFEDGHANSISNLVRVVEYFQDLINAIDDLELKLDELEPIIVDIKDEVATIETIVGQIKVKVDDIQPKVVDIHDDWATVVTKVGTIEGKVTDIDWSDVTTTKSGVATIETGVGNLEAIVPEDLKDRLPPTETATTLSITAVLAAIAAIASIIAVVVLLRRLKVAG